jgi:hypothetical protein
MFECTPAALSEGKFNGCNLKINNLESCNSPGFKAVLHVLKLPLYKICRFKALWRIAVQHELLKSNRESKNSK